MICAQKRPFAFVASQAVHPFRIMLWRHPMKGGDRAIGNGV
jgi:hypothetical protein